MRQWPSLRTRFEAKYIPEPNSGCWLWIGATAGRPPEKQGHERPHISIKGWLTPASHLSWELYKGSVPAEMHVLHRCDNPLCVNPDHLFLGTHLDNMRDMANKGRSNVPKGEAHKNSKLTNCEVWEIRELYGHVLSSTLAKAYGVSRWHIRRIQLGTRR